MDIGHLLEKQGCAAGSDKIGRSAKVCNGIRSEMFVKEVGELGFQFSAIRPCFEEEVGAECIVAPVCFQRTAPVDGAIIQGNE